MSRDLLMKFLAEKETSPSQFLTTTCLVNNSVDWAFVLKNPETEFRVYVQNQDDVYIIGQPDNPKRTLTKLDYDPENACFVFKGRHGRVAMEIDVPNNSFSFRNVPFHKIRMTRADRKRRLDLWVKFISSGNDIDVLAHMEEEGCDQVDGEPILCICSECMIESLLTNEILDEVTDDAGNRAGDQAENIDDLDNLIELVKRLKVRSM